MGELQQTYAWSNSRVRLFRECKYKYYLHYILSWTGWNKNAPPEKQKAYLLKNLSSIPMWAGSIVHDIIETVIKNGRQTKKWMSRKDAKEMAVQALRKGWKQSKNEMWKLKVKGNLNLKEHYYNEDIGRDYTDLYKQKILACIQAFYDFSFFGIICSLPNKDWLSLEDFQSFQMKNGEKVAVKIDCGFRYKNRVVLLDWKTGKLDNNVIDQLTVYAMYAMKMGWAKGPEDIIIVPVFLAAYAQDPMCAVPELTVTMPMIKKQANIISQEYPMLLKAHENKDNPDFFEATDNKQRCQWCNFRDMCDKR